MALFFDALGVSGVVASCKQCHAVAYVRASNNLLVDVVKEIVFAASLVFLMIAFGSVWVGAGLIIVWSLLRLVIKTLRPLSYIQH